MPSRYLSYVDSLLPTFSLHIMNANPGMSRGAYKYLPQDLIEDLLEITHKGRMQWAHRLAWDEHGGLSGHEISTVISSSLWD